MIIRARLAELIIKNSIELYCKNIIIENINIILYIKLLKTM